jgi:hypothetical protein
MKRALTLALPLFLLAACIDNDPVTVDDVILSLDVVNGPLIADGHSQITIEICTKSTSHLDPKLTAALKTSAGSWAAPDADPKSATVAMSAACEDRGLVVTNDPSTLTVTATVGTFVKSLPIPLQAAPIHDIRLTRQGALSTTAASMLTITANLDVANNGHPSLGTVVHFDVVATGTGAYFSEPDAKLVMGDSVQSTLFVAAGTTQLTVTVTATPPGGVPQSSSPLVITF